MATFENIAERMRLVKTINADCKEWESVVNNDSIIISYLYLNECSNSKETDLYQLILNGNELWYGTLSEINAVVKTMIVRAKTCDFLY